MRYITLIIIFSFSLFSQDLFDSRSLLDLKKVGDYHLSPNANFAVLTLSETQFKKNGSVSQLWIINILTKSSFQLTSSGDHNFSPLWHPNGDEIIFLSDRSGSVQAWKIRLSGGEAIQLTDFDEGISNIKISPNGNYLSYTQEVKINEEFIDKYPDYDKANVLIYDDLHVRHWDKWEDEKFQHIFIYNLETKEITDILEGEAFDAPLKPFGGRAEYDWSPESNEITYTCKKVDNYTFSTNSDLFIYNIERKETKNITEGMLGYEKEPLYSPNGKWIAFHSMERAGYESDKNRLMIYYRRTNEIKDLTVNLDQPVHNSKWYDDKGLVTMAPDGKGTNQIYYIRTDGVNTLMTGGQYDHGLRGISSSQQVILFSKEDFNTPPELHVMNTRSKGPEKISSFNDEFMSTFKECKVEAKWIESKDGRKVHTWVVYPPDFDPNKKYPMITYCQGGPQQMISQYFSYGWSFKNFASQGYVVVAPNRRGCPGFGQDWTDAINQDYGGMPMHDIMFASKEIAKEEYIDNDKIASVGASAGGYMTFWLAGQHEGFFNAFISHCGIFNKVSMYGSTEELFFPNHDNGGPYWDNREYYDKNSPHNFVKNWDTPILIITGELDYRVPYTQSLEAFTAARSLGIPARLVHFPKENHWVLHPQEQMLWYDEFFNFLKKHLNN